MTIIQIKYFLTAARILNFTEAAKQLYISQPALSQQIFAMENELNMQLFIRNKNKLCLTPAGSVLLQELPQYEMYYEDILKKAKAANEGCSGYLKIGFLQGQILGQKLQERYSQFLKIYPNIAIELCSLSFRDLREKLQTNELDMIYTIDFVMEDLPYYQFHKVGKNTAFAMVSRNHPLAKQKITQLNQLRDETIISMSDYESKRVTEKIVEDCKKAGFIPNLKYASSLDEEMLWVDAGVGVGISNDTSYMFHNPNNVILNDLWIGETNFIFAWLKSNNNPVIGIFENFVMEYLNR